MSCNIKLKLLENHKESDTSFGLPIPKKVHSNDAGFDLCAAISEPVVLQPGQRVLVPVGFSMEIPDGFEAQVRPRSGLAIKNGITVLNTPGTIDSGYRGEVKVILYNTGDKDFVINRGDRIAQMVIQKLPDVRFEIVDDLSDSDRKGGFGSTGV